MRKKNAIIGGVVGLILLTIIGVSVLGKQAIIAQMNAWKLLPLPETFTELYFENHQQLPTIIYPNTLISFSFTIHNLEYKTMQYPYEIYDTANGQKQTIDANEITLKQDQYKTITENFTLPNPATRSAVVVNLVRKHQQIDFWVEGFQPPSVTPPASVVPFVTPTPIQRKVGAWYWQPSLNRAQIWMGKNIDGSDIWINAYPTPSISKVKK